MSDQAALHSGEDGQHGRLDVVAALVPACGENIVEFEAIQLLNEKFERYERNK